MRYTVSAGDTLWSIARRLCNDGLRWRDIARDNGLSNADRLLVGQVLTVSETCTERLPGAHAAGDNIGVTGPPRGAGAFAGAPFQAAAQQAALIPAASYLFVLADEIDPTRGKVVRRVLVNPRIAQQLALQIGKPVVTFAHPERFGFMPSGGNGGNSALSPGAHARGFKPSPFVSVSSKVLGAPRMAGTPFWIDLDKAKAAGASVHSTAEILDDLDRMIAKAADASTKAKLAQVKSWVAADKEVLIKGGVPAAAVKGPGAMALTRGLQGVQIIGFTMTAVNVAHAAEKSVHSGSAKPLAAETVRQVGGWASAWAGMKLGAAGGALLGIETGPGAIASGAVGGIVGGFAGYFGFDWIADHIDAN